MPKGNPGQPKSPAHRKAISDGVKAHYESARSHLDYALERMDDRAGFRSVDDVGDVVYDLVWALKAVLEASTERQAQLRDAVGDLRAQLAQRGGAIKAMDVSALSRAKATGLLPDKVVDDEYRRRSSFIAGHGSFGRTPTDGLGMGAAMNGWTVCPGCSKGVFLEESGGSSYHRQCQPKAPRQYIDGRYMAVDLDASLAEAEKDHADAQAKLDDAAGRVEQARRAIQRFDERVVADGDGAAGFCPGPARELEGVRP